MADTVPEEHLQRLELAVRAAELVPTDAQAEGPSVRSGMAGDVPLRLSLQRDGTLEIRARPPHPLPEGLEIQRDANKSLLARATNPADARRLSAHTEARRRLEALFDAAPSVRVAEGAVMLDLPPETKEEQLRGALRAVLRATSALSEVSDELSRAAEKNRQQVRSTAVPGQLDGGRRFIKLLPEEGTKKAETQWEKEARIVKEALEMLFQGVSKKQVLDYIQQQEPNPLLSRALMSNALRQYPRHRRQMQITVLLSVGLMALVFYVLYRLNLVGRISSRWDIWAVAVTSCVGSFFIWKGVGRFLNRRDEIQEKDGLYRVLYKSDKD